MNHIIRFGIDLAKNSFAICGVDQLSCRRARSAPEVNLERQVRRIIATILFLRGLRVSHLLETIGLQVDLNISARNEGAAQYVRN